MKWRDKVKYYPSSEWHTWFAWFPVNVRGYQAYPGTYIWLENVERRYRVGETGWDSNRWEYREIERVPPGGGDQEMWDRFNDLTHQG